MHEIKCNSHNMKIDHLILGEIKDFARDFFNHFFHRHIESYFLILFMRDSNNSGVCVFLSELKCENGKVFLSFFAKKMHFVLGTNFIN